MAEASIPVDLRNPGQVFACLGLMEAAEILVGPAQGRFGYQGSETRTRFHLEVAGGEDPVRTVLSFLAAAKARALAPAASGLADADKGVATLTEDDPLYPFGDGETYPCPLPDKLSALPMLLDGPGGAIPVWHWVDGNHSGRDNVKFWAGAGGYSGTALARDAIALLNGLGDNSLTEAAADPFAFAAPQSSSFRFDWRRDYISRDLGFSPNEHKKMCMVGFPLVELLAAIGLQHARPRRTDKLRYHYGVSNAVLPTIFARAVLGCQALGFPVRRFAMRLGWSNQEDQARSIIDAQEESAT